VGGALITGGTAAVQGISMLNPQRWGGNSTTPSSNQSTANLETLKDNDSLFEVGEDDENEDFVNEKPSSLTLPGCEFEPII
jgi:recyclin-1